jgi:AraC-like DNA-binding protein
LVEPGVPFCAQTLTVRSPVLPAAYDWLELIVVREGTGVVTHRDASTRDLVRPGDVVFLMPNVPCGINPEGQVRLTRLFLAMEYLAEQVKWQYAPRLPDLVAATLVWGQTHPQQSQVVRVGKADYGALGGCLDLLSELTRLFRLRREHYRAGGLVLGVLGLVVPLLEAAAPCRADPDTAGRASMASTHVLRPLRPEVRQARRLVEERFTEALSVAWLADQVCLSRAQLSRLFTAQMGKTPRAYRDGLRVQAMVRLLAGTDLSVADVARRVGWRSDDQAVAVFKEAVGLTPAVYRAAFHTRDEGPGTVDRLMFPADLLIFEH